MKEVVLSTSVLILAFVLLRLLFHKSISRQVQYALWMVVLLRLLLPVSPLDFDWSIASLARDTQGTISAWEEPVFYAFPVERSRTTSPPISTPGASYTPPTAGTYLQVSEDGHFLTRYLERFTLSDVLYALWAVGAVLSAAFFLGSNLHFAARLKRNRILQETTDTGLPVYLCGELPSPCLFGLFRPAIYLNYAAFSSPTVLRHVLAHEESHYAQRDHIWSVLRGLCLCLHWFNPLVWLAAVLSRRDCELACDERVLAHLGEDERLPYGHSLLSLVPLDRLPASPLLSATTMQSGKRQLRERILRIAQKRQPTTIALLAILMLLLGACAVTFTGETSPPHSKPLLGEPVARMHRNDITRYQAPSFVLDPIDTMVLDINILSSLTLQDGSDLFVYTDDAGDYCMGYRWAQIPDNGFDRFATFPAYDAQGDGSPNQPPKLMTFSGLFGQDGFVLHYRERSDESLYRQVHDYFYQAEDGSLRLLLRSFRDEARMDLNADGREELFSAAGQDSALWFEEDGTLYCATLATLIPDILDKENVYLDVGSYDAEAGVLPLSLSYQMQKDETHYWVSGDRFLAFNGEEILLYQDKRTTVDHVMEGIEAPKAVLSAALERIGAVQLTALREAQPGLICDDWRLERLSFVDDYTISGLELAVYVMNYEFHVTNPEQVILAGGSYLREDGWYLCGYPNAEYLIFEKRGDTLFYRNAFMNNDSSPDSEIFLDDLSKALQ